MAKKRRSTARRRTTTRTTRTDSKSFLLIVGGGFLVIVMSLYFMGALTNTKRTVARGDTTVAEEKKADTVMVSIKNYAFSPQIVTVKKGATVTFTNEDSVQHSATADDGSFDTGLLATGKSGSHTFDTVGTFEFYCSAHPSMKGKVVVVE